MNRGIDSVERRAHATGSLPLGVMQMRTLSVHPEKRRLADLPCAGMAVGLRMQVRKLFFHNQACQQYVLG